MTTCSVSPERHSTTLYSSDNALDWTFEGIVLDHQNKDMLIFEGLIGGKYWAQTRPLGDLYFAYPPGSEWRAGPSINLATSPDALHWKPLSQPGIRPHSGDRRDRADGRRHAADPDRSTGWLTPVARGRAQGDRRHLPHLLVAARPRRSVRRWSRTSHDAAARSRTRADRAARRRDVPRNVVFTTGIADAGDHFVVASGEADLACRITHVPKSVVLPNPFRFLAPLPLAGGVRGGRVTREIRSS